MVNNNQHIKEKKKVEISALLESFFIGRAQVHLKIIT